MARKYSRSKGKSGSTKPLKKALPSWIRYKAKEVEMLISKLSKDSKSPSMIGLILRDSYGIPDVKKLTGKNITQILAENKLGPKLPEDLLALVKKTVELDKHLKENHKDYSAKRGLQLTNSKINALVKYFKRSGKLDKSWKYNPERASILLE